MSATAPLSMQNRRDWTRRAVHLSFGACALLVPLLGRWPCVAIAGAAVFYNGMLAPWLGFDRAYRREGERCWSGLTTYPLAVLLLLLFLPLPVAVGSWGVLAVADPVAAGVGSLVPQPRIPYHKDKSVSGSAAGFVASAAACFGLLAYMHVPHAAGPALTAAAAGVVAESLPLRLDDNLPIAVAGAAALLAWGIG